MLSGVERMRLRFSRSTEAKKKAKLGQFLTPERTARFMAGLFNSTPDKWCRLLDPGAGIGSLSCAFFERCLSGELHFEKIEAAAFELDNTLCDELNRSLSLYAEPLGLEFEISCCDFIASAVSLIRAGRSNYTHAILNPPYKKIGSLSPERLLLREVGIETVNLYSGFMALVIGLMAPGGQVVAIIPRSFCNGPYYRSFRELLLKKSAIHRIHLFKSRSRAFRDDAVLQENVILFLERGGQQGDVVVSTSEDDEFRDMAVHTYPFDRIVLGGDLQRFIHVPTSTERSPIELYATMEHSLESINLKVSTGPVVDFRLKEHLRNTPTSGTIPLLYPAHFCGQRIVWPRPNIKKPNAIERNVATERWLYPNGFYCVVRRFSSKEEKRRIVASVVQPDTFGGVDVLGFENHLNVFHNDRRGLSEPLARGLAMFLNSTAVDCRFRRFSGHTQVNATDLRTMTYPSREQLIELGEWMMTLRADPTQAMIDAQLERVTACQRRRVASTKRCKS